MKICGQLDSPIPTTAHDNILRASPLFVQGWYALANDYNPVFDPKNPFQFKQLVTNTIRQGDPFVYKLLDCILQPIGRVVCRGIATGL